MKREEHEWEADLREIIKQGKRDWDKKQKKAGLVNRKGIWYDPSTDKPCVVS
jgi:hypothetical protein